MAAKKGSLERVGEVAKGLVTSVGNAAEKHVVKPVGKALGLTGSKAKGGAKAPPAAAATKAAKPVAKAAKSTAKAAQRTAARATAAVKKAAPKVGGAKKTSPKSGK